MGAAVRHCQVRFSSVPSVSRGSFAGLCAEKCEGSARSRRKDFLEAMFLGRGSGNGMGSGFPGADSCGYASVHLVRLCVLVWAVGGKETGSFFSA